MNPRLNHLLGAGLLDANSFAGGGQASPPPWFAPPGPTPSGTVNQFNHMGNPQFGAVPGLGVAPGAMGFPSAPPPPAPPPNLSGPPSPFQVGVGPLPVNAGGSPVPQGAPVQIGQDFSAPPVKPGRIASMGIPQGSFAPPAPPRGPGGNSPAEPARNPGGGRRAPRRARK